LKYKSTITVILILFILLFSNITISSKNIHENYKFNLISGFRIELLNNRIFFWKQPDSSIPENGYPVLFLFHGAVQHAFAWFIGLNKWSKSQSIFTDKALEEGFFIISAESLKPVKPGPRAWDIFNDLSNSKDYIFIRDMIVWLENSNLSVDSDSLYCAGFSSGAFMCSYIGHFFNDRFKAIAVHSGANSESISLTPRGPYFDLNGSYTFSSDFPPTIIIHGRNDSLVPVICAENFYLDLQRSGIPSKLLISNDKGHIWNSEYDVKILDWFQTY
jgi:poly(3-hydroxybutyrate) depolymerase